MRIWHLLESLDGTSTDLALNDLYEYVGFEEHIILNS